MAEHNALEDDNLPVVAVVPELEADRSAGSRSTVAAELATVVEERLVPNTAVAGLLVKEYGSVWELTGTAYSAKANIDSVVGEHPSESGSKQRAEDTVEDFVGCLKLEPEAA